MSPTGDGFKVLVGKGYVLFVLLEVGVTGFNDTGAGLEVGFGTTLLLFNATTKLYTIVIKITETKIIIIFFFIFIICN
jgi:hypothetical protein